MAIEPWVLLDEDLSPRDEARISPFDRGFLFGDGLYEGMKVLSGRPLFLDRHLERLAYGLEALRIPLDLGALADRLHRLIAANGTDAGFLYLQITRGAATERRHLPPPGLRPTVFAFVERRGFPLPAGAPQRAMTLADFRWRRADLKGTSLLGTTLGKLAAARSGADEVIWRGERGRLLEGGNTNVFVRSARGLETAPLGHRLLPGVTRGLVLDFAHRRGLPIVLRAPRLAERSGWLEVFVTGTVTGVQAVVELDGLAVAEGRVGEWTRSLAEDLAAAEWAAAGWSA
ncbi:MAG: aminotransferase class IV [Thermoanaerobaculia bacterium]|nr:aminotransferase class IV [Thermoanaerobaculia bacterium]